MKSHIFLLGLFLLLPGLVMAQTGAAAPLIPSAPIASAPLPTENLSLAVTGTMAGDVPVDLTFVVGGSELSAHQPLGQVELNGAMNSIAGSFTFNFSKVGDNYRVSYTMTAAIPALAGAPPARAVNYHVATLKGTAIVHPGRPLAILDAGGKTLTLSLIKTGQ